MITFWPALQAARAVAQPPMLAPIISMFVFSFVIYEILSFFVAISLIYCSLFTLRFLVTLLFLCLTFFLDKKSNKKIKTVLTQAFEQRTVGPGAWYQLAYAFCFKFYHYMLCYSIFFEAMIMIGVFSGVVSSSVWASFRAWGSSARPDRFIILASASM